MRIFKKHLINLILKKFKKNNINYKLTKYLGSGSYGDAYLLSNGNVLKFTCDEKEAKASSILIGKKNEYLLDIYNVYEHKSSYLGEYVIEEEYIKDSGHIKNSNFLEQILIISNEFEDYMDELYSGNKKIKKQIYEKIFDDIRDYYHKENFKKSFDVLIKIINELKKNKIHFEDFHEGNFGIKNNHLCVIDLGLSETNKKENIKLLEQILLKYYARF